MADAPTAAGSALDDVAPAPKSDAAAATNRWVEPAARLRATMRWILGVFGAIGTAFLGALPFTGLADLGWPSASGTVAVIGAIVLVVGLVLVLRAGSEVFISRAGSLTDFVRTWQDSQGFGLAQPKYELFGGLVESPEGLVSLWEARRTTVQEAEDSAAGAPADKERAARLEVAKARFAEVDAMSTNVVALAAYRELVMVYRWGQRWVVRGAVLVAGGAFVFFAVAAGSGDAADTPATASAPASASASTAAAAASGVAQPTSSTAAPMSASTPAPATTEGGRPGQEFGTWLVGALFVAITLLLAAYVVGVLRRELNSKSFRDAVLESAGPESQWRTSFLEFFSRRRQVRRSDGPLR